jgi:hypothetical protein
MSMTDNQTTGSHLEIKANQQDLQMKADPKTTMKWTLNATKKLLCSVKEIMQNREVTSNDWECIAQQLSIPADECVKWWLFLEQLRKKISPEEKSCNGSKDNSISERKKRKRRKASDIQRTFRCQYPNCVKAYGTEGALKCHMVQKHKDIRYVPSYLYPYAQSKPAVFRPVLSLPESHIVITENVVLPQYTLSLSPPRQLNVPNDNALSPLSSTSSQGPPQPQNLSSNESESRNYHENLTLEKQQD